MIELNVNLREINNDNFMTCVNLEVDDNQKNFVANNMKSLAQAWLEYEYAQPFAIYNGDVMVGFIMFHVKKDKKECYMWRFMMDKNHQGKGYGKAALTSAIEHYKNTMGLKEMLTSIVPGNDAAVKLYENLGFKFTGEIDDGEHVMKLSLDGSLN